MANVDGSKGRSIQTIGAASMPNINNSDIMDQDAKDFDCGMC
jgi:hypothetical protein